MTMAANSSVSTKTPAELKAGKDHDQALKANQAKSKFLSNLSHEFRTPLNAIMGFSQLLDSITDEPLSKSQTEYVCEIRKASTHLLDLINEILDLSRIEAGNLQLELSTVPIARMLTECCEEIEPLAKERGIRVEADFAGIDNIMVNADPIRLRQILVNLLANAVKYNCLDGTVNVLCLAKDQSTVRIEINDTGEGIPADLLDELLQPFYHHSMHERKVEGTGIGLLLSKSLVELMDGVIGIESTPGSGTQLWIELQREFVDEKNPSCRDNPEPVKSQNEKCPPPCTLLYIEDNETNFVLVQEILKRRPNISLIHASTAESGIELCKTKHPDIFLLDLNLPGMSGFEALRSLRAIEMQTQTPAVAVSAYAGTKDQQRALETGFNEYITKPIDVHHFLDVIDKLITDIQYTTLRQAGTG